MTQVTRRQAIHILGSASISMSVSDAGVTNLLVALAERGAPFVLCGANHNAIGMLLTLDGHHVQAKRIEAQWAAALPLHKRLWAAVVKCKLEQQAAALEAAGAPTAPLQALVGKVNWWPSRVKKPQPQAKPPAQPQPEPQPDPQTDDIVAKVISHSIQTSSTR